MNLGKLIVWFEKWLDMGIGFNDIVGIDEVKVEFEEIVLFLKEFEKYMIVGVKILKGILLVGLLGIGKMLLVKVIVNEVDVLFFSVVGFEFVEMFIGIGVVCVCDLFKKVLENVLCIVFIDEIDVVGWECGVGVGGGNDECE